MILTGLVPQNFASLAEKLECFQTSPKYKLRGGKNTALDLRSNPHPV